MNATLEKERARLEAGLTLFTDEQADRLIGSPGDGYEELVQAVQASNNMLYALNLGQGLKRNRATADIAAKVGAMFLTLVHNAYALGIQHGLERARSEEG